MILQRLKVSIGETPCPIHQGLTTQSEIQVCLMSLCALQTGTMRANFGLDGLVPMCTAQVRLIRLEFEPDVDFII